MRDLLNPPASTGTVLLANVACRDRRSLELTVPGDWNTQDPRLLYYEGTVWYRTIVAIDTAADPGSRQFLHFGAANHRGARSSIA